jgi:hypothetical protein
MSVPGVNVICAATFLAAIGDIRRFKTSRQLVGDLGLDPKVRQSGSSPARGGRISKQGSPHARWALVEAAFSAVRQPGPLHAFYERIRARRGHGIATVAAARKLTVLFWCLLTREEQYAHQQPSLTAKKLRRLELTAGAKRYDTNAAGIWSTNQAMREAERALALQAEASYVRMVRDWQASTPKKVGASVTRSAHNSGPLRGKRRAAGSRAPNAGSSTRHRLAPEHNLTPHTNVVHPRRGPRVRKYRPHNRANRPDPPPNRPHRSPSTARGDTAPRKTGPPKSSPQRLTFIRRPEQARCFVPASRLPEQPSLKGAARDSRARGWGRAKTCD